MKVLSAAAILLMPVFIMSCEVQSGITKKQLEKYMPTPTPVFSPVPTPTPVPEAEIIKADITADGETINVSKSGEKTIVTCAKFNRVMVNGSQNTVIIKGACQQIMLNGSQNTVTADAAMEYILNGSGNTLEYSRFVNGKLPQIVENQAGNTIERKAPKAK